MLSCGSIFHFLKLKLLLYETVVVCAAHTSHCMDVVSIPLLVIGSGTGVSGCQMYVVELACQMYVMEGILLIPLGVLPSSTAKAADGFIGL